MPNKMPTRCWHLSNGEIPRSGGAPRASLHVVRQADGRPLRQCLGLHADEELRRRTQGVRHRSLDCSREAWGAPQEKGGGWRKCDFLVLFIALRWYRHCRFFNLLLFGRSLHERRGWQGEGQRQCPFHVSSHARLGLVHEK